MQKVVPKNALRKVCAACLLLGLNGVYKLLQVFTNVINVFVSKVTTHLFGNEYSIDRYFYFS